MGEDENFLYGKPTEEVDEPLDNTPCEHFDLEAKKLEDRDKDRKEKGISLHLN